MSQNFKLKLLQCKFTTSISQFLSHIVVTGEGKESYKPTDTLITEKTFRDQLHLSRGVKFVALRSH